MPTLGEAFLLSKQVGGCSVATLRAYRAWVKQLRVRVGDDPTALDAAVVTRFFAGLRERGLSASTIHQAYRSLKTFVRWLQAAGALDRSPLAGLSIGIPTTLPQVPTGEELRTVLDCCPSTLVGTRNHALILVMADAGLRASEVLRLLVEDWNPQERSLFIRPS